MIGNSGVQAMRTAGSGRRRRGGRLPIPAGFAAATGTDDPRLADRLLEQMIAAAGLPATLSARRRRDEIAALQATLAGLAPQSMVEGLLAAQMVGCHQAAMTCLARANEAGAQADPKLAEAQLRRAERLLGIYARQTGALIRARSAPRRPDAAEGLQVAGAGFEPPPWMQLLTADAQAWVREQLAAAARGGANDEAARRPRDWDATAHADGDDAPGGTWLPTREAPA